MMTTAYIEAERFYTASCEGDLTARGWSTKPIGKSFYVIDRLNCRRVVATYRSEDHARSRTTAEGQRAQAEHLAELEAARLNRLHSHSERDPARRQ